MDICCRDLTTSEFKDALAIRLKVFVEEQKVPIEEEQDHYDDTAIHFGCFVDNNMVATGRLIIDGDKAKVGRMAVLKEYRGFGLGLKLLQTIVKKCQNLELNEISLGSQIHALPFYEKAGFQAEGDVFMEAGIPHRMMYYKVSS